MSLDEILDIRAAHTYLVHVAGDLMAIDHSQEAQPGDIVISSLNIEPQVKRLACEGHQLELCAENPRCAATSWKATSWPSWALHFCERCPSH